MRLIGLTLLTLAVWLLPGCSGATAETLVPEARDLQALGEEARERNLPVLLMFSAEHCGYCKVMKRDFLDPMIISGEYEEKVIIRRIEVDHHSPLIGFDGEAIRPGDLMRRYSTPVTPTLVFIDHRGEQLTDKLVGLGTPDFFFYYIDRAVDASLDRLRSGDRVAQTGGSAG